MPDPLPDLEARRSSIRLEIAQLGDFRPGSVRAYFRRCGKPNCACARKDHAGHGPQVRLSCRRDGKTVQEALSDPGRTRKAEREVAAFRRFQQLSAELIEVNLQICQLRPPQAENLDPVSCGPKKNAARHPGRRPGRGRQPPASDRQRPASTRLVRSRGRRTGHARSPAPGQGPFCSNSCWRKPGIPSPCSVPAAGRCAARGCAQSCWSACSAT